MKFARIVERGNRQILLQVIEEDGEYNVLLTTPIIDGDFFELIVGPYPTQAEAAENMMSTEDDELLAVVLPTLDAIADIKYGEQ